MECGLKSERESFTPRNMIIYENGNVARKIKDVLVGEVWIAGGQSNMAWHLKDTTEFERAKIDVEKISSHFRYFIQPSEVVSKTPQKQFDKTAKWLVPSSENCSMFSGVAYYYAEKLVANVDCPVAIIYGACGATNMATWISAEYQQKLPHLQSGYNSFKKELDKYTPEIYKKRLAEHKAKLAKMRAEKKQIKWIDTL